MSEQCTDSGATAALDLVQFSLYGSRAGVVAAQVQPVHANTYPGDVVAVETLAGLVPVRTTTSARRVLLSLTGVRGADLVVDVEKMADLVRMPHAEIHPLPSLLAARNQLKGLRALGWQPDAQDDPLVLLFDWHREPRFENHR